MKDFPKYLEARAARLKNLYVFLNTEATVDKVKQFKPDIVVNATGSVPLVPPIKGLKENIEAGNVATIFDMINNLNAGKYPDEACKGKKVVVVGGGSVGLDVIEYFAPRGAECTIIDMLPQIGMLADPITKCSMRETHDKYSVKEYVNTALQEVKENAFTVKLPDGQIKDMEFDLGFNCLGMRSNNPVLPELEEAFKDTDTYVYTKFLLKRKEEKIMPNVTGHTELVGLMAYPIRHTQSPTTHNLAYDKNGDDVIQLAFEVDNDSLKDAVQSIRALKMLGSNISMPNKTVVHKYLDEVDEAAKLCGAINTVVNMRDENGQVTGKLKGYNTDGMGYWQGLKEEGIDFKGMKMVLIGTGGAATAIAVRGALDGIAEIEIFNIKDKFYSRGEEIVDLINKNTNCKATMNDLADHDLLKEKMHAADLFCDATGVGMHPLEDLSNIPDTSFFYNQLPFF